jgi:hypothetical protein
LSGERVTYVCSNRRLPSHCNNCHSVVHESQTLLYCPPTLVVRLVDVPFAGGSGGAQPRANLPMEALVPASNAARPEGIRYRLVGAMVTVPSSEGGSGGSGASSPPPGWAVVSRLQPDLDSGPWSVSCGGAVKEVAEAEVVEYLRASGSNIIMAVYVVSALDRLWCRPWNLQLPHRSSRFHVEVVGGYGGFQLLSTVCPKLVAYAGVPFETICRSQHLVPKSQGKGVDPSDSAPAPAPASASAPVPAPASASAPASAPVPVPASASASAPVPAPASASAPVPVPAPVPAPAPAPDLLPRGGPGSAVLVAVPARELCIGRGEKRQVSRVRPGRSAPEGAQQEGAPPPRRSVVLDPFAFSEDDDDAFEKPPPKRQMARVTGPESRSVPHGLGPGYAVDSDDDFVNPPRRSAGDPYPRFFHD